MRPGPDTVTPSPGPGHTSGPPVRQPSSVSLNHARPARFRVADESQVLGRSTAILNKLKSRPPPNMLRLGLTRTIGPTYRCASKM